MKVIEIRDELIKIRTIFDLDVVKGKQLLTNLINRLAEVDQLELKWGVDIFCDYCGSKLLQRRDDGKRFDCLVCGVEYRLTKLEEVEQGENDGEKE